MITKTKMTRYNYVGRAMALPLAFIIFCAFSLSFARPVSSGSAQQAPRDTMPMSDLMKIDFASVESFSINDKTALLTLKDKRSILVKKKVLDEYLAIKKREAEGKEPLGSIDQNGEKTYQKIEIEAAYPGGASAWMRYLNQTFRYPQEAQDKEIQGAIVVQFIVDKEGNVSDIHAILGTTEGGLREEAVRVIANSGKWLPGIQNGKKVKSYKKQPITFKLQAQ